MHSLYLFSFQPPTPPFPNLFFFFFNDTATTEIYTLSLHDALPISCTSKWRWLSVRLEASRVRANRSEEHTSELQSRFDLVCRLLLEKKKPTQIYVPYRIEQHTPRLRDKNNGPL